MRLAPAAACLLVVLASGCGTVIEVQPTGSVTLEAPAQTSVVLDAGGDVLAELHGEQDREVVDLEQMPDVLTEAVVAVEDERFYDHGGVDGRAIARAVVRNTLDGRVAEGGSTITQQLVKNTTTGDAQTLGRKLEEASLALQLEARLPKDEILERYLNTVYLGNGAYGVQTAAQRYFGVEVSELDLSQAALLAGMLKAPSDYDPFVHPEAATRRRDLVLGVMARQGLVTPDAKAAARATPLGLNPREPEASRRAPYFVAHVLAELQHDEQFAALGDNPKERAQLLFHGGLEITTTLDAQWQQAAEAAVDATLPEPEDPAGALVAVDPASGGIRALVGGRDYFDADDPAARFNLATQARRQPGSTFKPIALAAALTAGHTLDERYPAPATLELPAAPGEPERWQVANYDERDLGTLTLREATAASANTVFAQLVDDVGAADVAALARELGVESDLRAFRSIALGAQEVSVLDMASVQATLAAGGVRHEPTAVTRITAPGGQVLYERGTPRGRRVLDEDVAAQVTSALAGAVDSGTGERAGLRRPTAGKTGTSQNSADAWFTGYTPDLAAAVWIGFPDAQVPMVPPTTRARVEGGTWPAELFARFGMQALDQVPAREFAAAESALVSLAVDVDGGCLPTVFTARDRIAERSFSPGEEPTRACPRPDEPPVADVPDAVGAETDAARARLEDAGFHVRRRLEHSGSLPPGLVVRQDPEPGADQALTEGFQVTLWESSAERTPVQVPDVLNAELDDAVEALEDTGFVVETTSACPDGAPACTGASQRPGRVWEQAPDAGAGVPAHSVVTLRAYPRDP